MGLVAVDERRRMGLETENIIEVPSIKAFLTLYRNSLKHSSIFTQRRITAKRLHLINITCLSLIERLCWEPQLVWQESCQENNTIKSSIPTFLLTSVSTPTWPSHLAFGTSHRYFRGDQLNYPKWKSRVTLELELHSTRNSGSKEGLIILLRRPLPSRKS